MINRGLFQKHHILKGSGSPAATAAAAQAAAEKGLPTQNSAGNPVLLHDRNLKFVAMKAMLDRNFDRSCVRDIF